MVALLAPVDAVANKRSAAWQRTELNAEFRERFVTLRRQPIVDLGTGSRQALAVGEQAVTAAQPFPLE